MIVGIDTITIIVISQYDITRRWPPLRKEYYTILTTNSNEGRLIDNVSQFGQELETTGYSCGHIENSLIVD